MESEKKVDKRVVRSKERLKISLFELLAEKRISNITVKELCENGRVNRGTFYSHYKSPEDLMESIEKELFIKIGAMLANHKIENSSELFAQIFRCIKENGETCYALFGEHGDDNFVKKILLLAHDISVKEWERVIEGPGSKRKIELLYIYSANGAVGIMRDWIQKGMQENPEEIAELILKMTNKGIESFVTKSL